MEVRKNTRRSGDAGPAFVSRWPFFEMLQFFPAVVALAIILCNHGFE